MFIRRSRIRGKDYYSVVEGFRDELGRSRAKVIVSLGTNPKIPDAIRATEQSLRHDRELFVKVAKALVERWADVEIDPPKLIKRVVQKGLSGTERDLDLLDRIVDDELEAEEDEEAEKPAHESELPLPLWAQSKVAQLRRRIRENTARLKILNELRGKL